MAQIGIQSEAFLRLYQEVRPTLEMLNQQRQGFNRMSGGQPQSFFPHQVIQALGPLRELAERGIALAGAGASQVVLDANEVRMLEWSREQLKAS